MVVGSGIVAVCLLVLGWTTEIVSLFVKDAEKVCLFCSGPGFGICDSAAHFTRQKMSP